MAGRDVFPYMKDEQQRGSFRYGTNRKVELALQEERDNLARWSLMEVVLAKEALKNEPVSEAQQISRKLAPEFTPRKVREKRKSKPVFHDDLIASKSSKDRKVSPERQQVPNVPPYNPLDKEQSFTKLEVSGKTKRYPYSRENTITTEEMKKPQVSSVGVVPIRGSESLGDLKVMMHGTKAIRTEVDPIIGPVERANTAEIDKVMRTVPEEPSEAPTPDMTLPPTPGLPQSPTPVQKPAILAATGTLQPAPFVERPQPPAKPMSHLRVAQLARLRSGEKSRARSEASSFKSVEIHLPGEQVYSQYDDAIADIDIDITKPPTREKPKTADADDDKSDISSNASIKSVKDLVEEAKRIATGEKIYLRNLDKAEATKSSPDKSSSADKSSPRRTGGLSKDTKKRADAKKKPMTSKSSKSGKSDAKSVSSKKDEQRPRSERSVDEIIASLKVQSRGGAVSDADRKIQEIMDRVMSRTSVVLGDIGPQPSFVKEDTDMTIMTQTVVEDENENEAPPLHLHTDLSTVDEHALETDEVVEVQGPASGPVQKKDEETGIGTTDEEEAAVDTQTDNLPVTEDATAASTGAVAEGEPEPAAVTSDPIQPSDQPQVIQEALDKLAELSRHTTPVGPASAVTQADVQTDRDLETDLSSDLRQAWEDLVAPLDVCHEDIINISAKPSHLHTRQDAQKSTRPSSKTRPSSASNLSLLSTWKPAKEPVEKARDVKSIHHFCTVTDEVQMQEQYRGVWRRYHVPSKYKILSEFQEEGVSPTPSTRLPSQMDKDALNTLREEELEVEERTQSEAARRILEEANKMGDGETSDSLEMWQKRAQQVFDQSELEVNGQKVPLRSDESCLYWTPAPPKWDVPPAKVKEQLFPQYHGAEVPVDSVTAGTILEESDESEAEEDAVLDDMDPEDRIIRDRILSRTYQSARDLTRLGKLQWQLEQEIRTTGNSDGMTQAESFMTFTTETSGGSTARVMSGKRAGRPSDLDSISEGATSERSKGSLPPAPNISFAELRAKFSQAAVIEQLSEMGETDTDSFPLMPPLRRVKSAPAIGDKEDEDFLMIYQDFNTTMEEISKQRQQLRDIRAGKKSPPGKKQNDAENSDDELDSLPERRTSSVQILQLQPKKEEKPTPAELALQAGRNYVLLPKKPKGKKKKIDMSRIEEVERFLNEPPRKIERSDSMIDFKRELERDLRVPQRIRSRTRRSIPDLLDFDSYTDRKGYKEGIAENMREWVRDIWNHWFDLTFPPPPDSNEEWSEDSEVEEDSVMKEEKPKRQGSEASTELSETIEMLDPVIDEPEDEEVVKMLQDEADKLTAEIEDSKEASAFTLCRRGAILRKLGRIKQAHEDLDQAIAKEPMMLDAYWHRHLIFLLQNRKNQALDDLNFVLKHNKNHAPAYRSRANICRQLGDVTMAIINYTQAIKMNPQDHEAYYQRAEMYEERQEMLLALEDYAMATKLMPSRTDAIFKHGLHYFNTGNWNAAIQDFTDLLKQDPTNSESRLYRGRAYAKMKQWDSALEDISAAIHLDPMNAQAFYYRGCIIRKLHAKKALQDFSVSILIDDSLNNVNALLHRGILYNEIGRHEDAIPDFENVLKLDTDIAVAHVNLGLIYLLKLNNPHRAIKKFTAAIKVDPTYVRAYICRGEAYTKLHDIQNALLDMTRAIHLRPDIHHLYMYRGQLVLKTGNLELAAFCVRHAAELSDGLGQSPTQQAIVQSFLANYDKAITALDRASRVKPSAALFTLLGKTRMKAKLWKEAVDSFDKGLELLKPWQEKESWPAESAEIFYLVGLCQTEQRNYLAAHDAFNNAIKVNSKFAQAYYQRGLAKMRLKQSKGIQDFNRALALDASIFQAYLSRAAYYGLRGQYSKAILNCNEAIKLQPNSVRAYLYRGALKYHIKAYTLAIRDLTQAAVIDSTCALAYFNRAVCYQDSGEHQKALQDYGIVLLLGDQLMLKVLINRGLLYFERKDFKNALHDFLLGARVNPFDKKIHHTLGLCYHKLDKLQEAVQSFTKALELDNFFLDALIGRGNVFMDFGHDIGLFYAKHDYERALHINPLCLPARVNLAYTLQVSTKFMQAWHQFTTAIAINPDYKPALEGRAIINLQMSSTFAAFQDITASINVSPTAELLTNRGVVNQFMGDRVNAMRDYQQAIKLDPTYALAYYNAANMYFHLRQFKQAKAYFHMALQYNPKDESAYLNRAITKVMLRDGRGAMEDFHVAIKLSPHSAHMYFNRGNLYTSMKQFDKAEKDYSQALSLQPDDPLVLKRRADVRGKLGMKKEAIADYRRAIEIQSYKRS